MRLEENERYRREIQERQRSNDAVDRFKELASSNISTSIRGAGLAEDETDVLKLETLSEKLDTLKTGVGYVDDLIDINQEKVELRIRAVNVRDNVDKKLTELIDKLDADPTEGFDKILGAIKSEYASQVSNMTQGNKEYLDDKFKRAEAKYEYSAWRDQYDTDKLKSGYQLPDSMSANDKDYFQDILAPQIAVDKKTGDYDETVKLFQDMKTNMRTEDKRIEDIAGIIGDSLDKKELSREAIVNKIEGHVQSALKISLGVTVEDKDHGDRAFRDRIGTASDFSSGKSGERLEALDYKGWLSSINSALILISGDDMHNLQEDAVKSTSDPFDEENIRMMDDLIEKNKIGDKSYNTNSSHPSAALELIEARKLLLEAAKGGWFLDFDPVNTEAPPSVTTKRRVKY